MGIFTKKGWLSLLFAAVAVFGLSAQITSFDDDFESGVLDPAKWTQSPSNSPVLWSVGSSGVGTVAPQNGSKFVKLFSEEYQGPVKLITPLVDISAMNDPVVIFKMASQKFAVGTRDTLKVYYRTSASGEWTDMAWFLQSTNNWEQKVIHIKELVSYTPAVSTVQVAFEWCYANAKGIALDDIQIMGQPVCFVINLRTSNVTDQSAMLVWTSAVFAQRHNLKISSTPLADPVNDPADVYSGTVPASYYTVTGLTAETVYYWYVQSDCGTGDVTEWAAGTVTTKCEPSATGILYNFESGVTGGLPECWTRGFTRTGIWTATDLGSASADTLPAVVTAQSHSTSHSLRLFSYYAGSGSDVRVSPSYVSTPLLDVADIRAYQVKFWAKGDAGAKIHVGITTDLDNILAIQDVVDIPATAAWTEYTVYFNRVANGGKAVAFKLDAADIEGSCRVYIDDVEVSEAPACAKPVFPTVGNPSYDGAEINAVGTSATYNIVLYTFPTGNPSSDMPDYQFTNVTLPFVMTGLPQTTDYYAFIQGNCGGEWSSSVTFKTLQIPATLPLDENFEGQISWELINGTQTNKWIVGTDAKKGGDKGLYISNNGAANAYNLTAASYVYASRDLNLSSGVLYECNFYWRSSGESSTDILRAFLVPGSVDIAAGNAYGMTASTNTTPPGWIELTPALSGQAGWDSYYATAAVPATGYYHLVFFWKNNGSGGNQPPAAIDNVHFAEVACPVPDNMAYNALAATTVNVAWTGTASSYQVRLFPAGNIDPDLDAPLQSHIVQQHSIGLTGLSPNTAYKVYVRSICGSDSSYWASETFKTTLAFAELLINTGFEDDDDNSIWVFSHSTGPNKWAIGTAAKKDGSYGLYVSNDNGTTNAYDYNYVSTTPTSYSYAYVPVSLQAETEYMFAFDWKGNGESTYDLARAFLIPASANIADGAPNGMTSSYNTTPSGWIDIGGSAAPNLLRNQAEWQSVEKDVSVQSSGVYNLAFFWKNDVSGGTDPPAAIDNVFLASVPCGKPSFIDVTVFDVSANIAWSGSGSKYTVKVYPADMSNINPDNDQAHFTQADPATSAAVGNLTPNTDYVVYIKTECEDEDGNKTYSAWASKTFKTAPEIAQLPINTGFEADDDNSIWVFSHSTGTNKWAIGTAAKKDGSYGLYVSNNNGTANAYSTSSSSYSYAYVPVSLQAGTEYSFSFDWKGNGYVSYSSYYDLARAFLIPASADIANGNPNGMTYYDNPTPTGWLDIGGNAAQNLLLMQSSWQEVDRPVFVSTSGVYYLAFFWKNYAYSSGTNPPAAIDNVYFDAMPCSRPSDIDVSVLDVSADISWSGSGSRYIAKVYPYRADINPEADPAFFTRDYDAATTATAGSLTPNTDYVVYIKTECEDEDGNKTYSEWASKTFTTAPAIVNLPINTGFEDNNSIWVFSHSTGPNKWAIGTAAKKDGSKGLYVSNNNGTANAYTYTYDSDPPTSYSYAYVPVSLQAGTEYTFTFDWKGDGEDNYDLARAFLIPASANIANGAANEMTASTNTTPSGWLDIGGDAAINLLQDKTSWQSVEKTVTVPANGAYYLAFFWKNDYSGGANPPAAIDNVFFDEIKCPVVKGITVSHITAEGATVEWMNTAESYDIRITRSAINPETAEIGADELFFEDYPQNSIDLSTVPLEHSTPYFVYVRAICDNGYSSYYNMQPVKFTTACYPLSLSDPYIQKFNGYGAGADIIPSCWSGNIFASSASASGIMPYIVSGQASDSDNHSLRLDAQRSGENFSQACAVLPKFEEELTGLQAVFSAKATVAGAKLRLGVMEDDPSLTSSFAPLKEYALSTGWRNYVAFIDVEEAGLYGTQLAFMVDGDGEGVVAYTAYLDSVVIEPANMCQTPLAVNYRNLSNDSVTVYWESAYNSNTRDFQLIIATVNVAAADVSTLTPAQIFKDTVVVASDSAFITGLAPSTAYYYYVRMLCGDGAYSGWQPAAVPFITNCFDAEKCTYTISLHDIYGDGWNGNTLSVYANGVLAGNYTVPQPISYDVPVYDAEFELALCPGEIRFEYNATGGWPEENYWEIYREG
ncbi:MAG: fibronectin type III domain-containing protein, partial [Prevotellaceae bacterium]|nr:fibronectin type III domain-containing protein [Prevotellaceae bacterium]